MTTLRTSLLLAALGASLAGCDLGALFVDDPNAGAVTLAPERKLVIPALRSKKAKEEAASLRYPPAGEGLSREPFLTANEQTTLISGRKLADEPKIKREMTTSRPKSARPDTGKGLDWLEYADVGFIVFGQENGRRTAIIEGRLLQEGSRVGDYIVVAIDEDGIRLREANGTGTRVKDFRRKAASEVWH